MNLQYWVTLEQLVQRILRCNRDAVLGCADAFALYKLDGFTAVGLHTSYSQAQHALDRSKYMILRDRGGHTVAPPDPKPAEDLDTLIEQVLLDLDPPGHEPSTTDRETNRAWARVRIERFILERCSK